MTHALIQQLFDACHYPEVSLDTHAVFIARPGVNVLFFAGDPKKFRDTTDVAVVLPELDRAFEGKLQPGVVAKSAERELQLHYGFTAWPALVFVREGGYLGAITGIQNWGEYLQEINELIVAEVKPLNTFKVPVVSA
jgi:hydrogenase-1 operon protein HyaE